MPDGCRKAGLTWRTRLAQPRRLAPPGFLSLVPAIERGSTTLFARTADLRDTWDQWDVPYTYGLYGTPTTLELAGRLRELEGGYATLLAPGGQAALVLVYLACLSAGDHVLVTESIYGPSREFADSVLARLGVEVSYYPPTIGGEIRSLIRSNTRLVWCESPGSLTFEVQDIPAICAAAHEAGALVALDNTWAAGVHFDAFGHGVDVAVQALTKYVGGHSDLLLGSISVRNEAVYRRLGPVHAVLGLAVSPDDAYLALRGLQTLAIRLSSIEQSALQIAVWLAERPEIERVLHPALPSCPGHEIWRRDFTGSSGTFAVVFDRRFAEPEVAAFVDALWLFRIGYSWGGTTSLAIPGAGETSRSDYPYDHRLVRLSIGLESPSDLVADLARGLRAMRRRGQRKHSTVSSDA
jgi:cysteine-S-conjugate beta-lyase